MGRVKIAFPESPVLARIALPVRIGDLNYGGHLGNDRLLAYAHEARMQLLAGFGLSEMDCGGHSLIMADAEIAFRAEGFWGDVLHVAIQAGDATPKSFSLYYRLERGAGAETVAVAHIRTGLVAFDYGPRKTTVLSAALKSCLGF